MFSLSKIVKCIKKEFRNILNLQILRKLKLKTHFLFKVFEIKYFILIEKTYVSNSKVLKEKYNNNNIKTNFNK